MDKSDINHLKFEFEFNCDSCLFNIAKVAGNENDFTEGYLTKEDLYKLGLTKNTIDLVISTTNFFHSLYKKGAEIHLSPNWTDTQYQYFIGFAEELFHRIKAEANYPIVAGYDFDEILGRKWIIENLFQFDLRT